MRFILLLVKMHFMLLNVVLDCPILFLISVSHLPSGVMVQQRYLKLFTCLIFSPLQAMLHFGITAFFEMTMHSVFFALSCSPNFSLFSYCC